MARSSKQWRCAVSRLLSYYAKRRKRAYGRINRVKSLYDLCVEYLVKHFEHVDSLGPVGSSVRKSICEALVAANKFDGAAFNAITEPGIEALDLVDCAEITQDQLCDALTKLIPAGLQAIIINNCGRCFGPKTVRTIIKASKEDGNLLSVPFSLFAISLGGAYLLKDEYASELIHTCHKSLSSLEFRACPSLGTMFSKSIANCFSSDAGGNLLELAMENLSLSKKDLLIMASATHGLQNLKLCEMDSVDDEVVEAFLANDGLEGIKLDQSVNVTDVGLSHVRRCGANLRSLELGGLKRLTAVGLEILFTPDLEGLPQPPRLRKLDLSGLGSEAVTDAVLTRAANAASFAMKDGNGLVHLQLSGSPLVTDESMEALVDTCAGSLEELNVSYCPKITDKGLGYLVEKAGRQLSKLHVWGCAQLTDEFFDGHSRVADGEELEIAGVWMKKSGGMLVR